MRIKVSGLEKHFSLACPLASREETKLEALGGPRSWIDDGSFGTDRNTGAADQGFAEGRTRKSTAPLGFRPEVVSVPLVPSLRCEYAIGLLGICLVFAPMLEALGKYINLGWPLSIGGLLAVALAVAAFVQIEEWVMRAQIALGLSLFGLGCFGPTDAIIDICFCCGFGFLIAFLAAMQAENFEAVRACPENFLGGAQSPAGDKLVQIDR
jgi:hypothetical protein